MRALPAPPVRVRRTQADVDPHPRSARQCAPSSQAKSLCRAERPRRGSPVAGMRCRRRHARANAATGAAAGLL